MRQPLILALGALAAAVPAAAEQPLPTYPGTVHTRIGNDLVIGGEYYRMAYFLTPDPVARVAQYFAAEWDRLGIPTTVDGSPASQLVVSAFYTREGLQRSVVLCRRGGKTLGFSVLKDLWTRPDAGGVAEEAPLEGALFTQDFSARDGAVGRARTELVAADLGTVRARVVARLTGQGFRLVKETDGSEAGRKGLVMEFGKGGARVMQVLTAVDPATTARVQTWMGEGPR